MNTRTTGSFKFNSLEALQNANLNLAHPSDPIYQRSNKINEVAELYTSILDDPETAFLDRERNVITFERTELERENGNGEGSLMEKSGCYEISGAGNSEYKMSFPITVYKNGQAVSVAGGTLGLTAFLQGSNKSRSAMVTGGEAKVLACLNGMITSLVLDQTKQKQTMNLDIRVLILQGLQTLANSYQGYGTDVEKMKDRTITRSELHDCLISARQLKVASMQGLGHVLDIFEGKQDSEFFADDNKKPTVWRLFNSFTRYAESQSSAQVRQQVIGGVYWPLAKSGLFDLPKHCVFPADYQSITVDNSSDDFHAVDDRQAQFEDAEYIDV